MYIFELTNFSVINYITINRNILKNMLTYFFLKTDIPRWLGKYKIFDSQK